jgi:hypothetical protein
MAAPKGHGPAAMQCKRAEHSRSAEVVRRRVGVAPRRRTARHKHVRVLDDHAHCGVAHDIGFTTHGDPPEARGGMPLRLHVAGTRIHPSHGT